MAVIAALALTLLKLTKLAPYLAQLRTGSSARLLVCSSACLHVCMSACLHEIVSHHVELDARDSTRLMRSNMCTANSNSVSKRALRLPHGQRRCATDTVEGIVIDDFDDLGCISSCSHYKPSKIPLTHLCTMHMQACARLGDAMRGPIPSWRFVFTRHHQRASRTSDASSSDYNTAF
ncbi:hypothetical protein GGR59_003886 [Xanthomonas arboricola]|nr:hypothetical protein [Xanthomonas arboricola]